MNFTNGEGGWLSNFKNSATIGILFLLVWSFKLERSNACKMRPTLNEQI